VLHAGERKQAICGVEREVSTRSLGGEPGVELGTARLRYTSQRLIALGVGNKAVPLSRLVGHAGTKVLEA